MQFYLVYRHKNEKDIEHIKFIKDGFSFSAFLFNIIWLALHGIWKMAAIILVIMLIIHQIPAFTTIGQGFVFIMNLAICIYIGYSARDWHIKVLEKKGYEFFDIVAANDLNSAKLAYLNKVMPSYN